VRAPAVACRRGDGRTEVIGSYVSHQQQIGVRQAVLCVRELVPIGVEKRRPADLLKTAEFLVGEAKLDRLEIVGEQGFGSCRRSHSRCRAGRAAKADGTLRHCVWALRRCARQSAAKARSPTLTAYPMRSRKRMAARLRAFLPVTVSLPFHRAAWPKDRTIAASRGSGPALRRRAADDDIDEQAQQRANIMAIDVADPACRHEVDCLSEFVPAVACTISGVHWPKDVGNPRAKGVPDRSGDPDMVGAVGTGGGWVPSSTCASAHGLKTEAGVTPYVAKSHPGMVDRLWHSRLVQGCRFRDRFS
jgi:hypothetical protein